MTKTSNVTETQIQMLTNDGWVNVTYIGIADRPDHRVVLLRGRRLEVPVRDLR